jgi:putative transposase
MVVDYGLARCLSVVKQCEMIGLCRANHYYAPVINENIIAIKTHIQKIYEDIPIYGSLKVHQQLLEDGYQICVNSVQKYRKELGLKAVLAVRSPNLSEPNKAHKKYSYKLRGVNISSVDQVWSTDITYSVPILRGRKGLQHSELEHVWNAA